MRSLRFGLALGVCVAAAVALPVAAGPPAGDDGVVTYTNADLEKFGPPAVPDTAPAVASDEDAWQFVTAFLDREHARLDAEKDRRLEKRRVEAERPVAGIGYPYLGYWGIGRLRTCDRYGHHSRVHQQPRRLSGVDAFPSNRRRAEREASR